MPEQKMKTSIPISLTTAMNRHGETAQILVFNDARDKPIAKKTRSLTSQHLKIFSQWANNYGEILHRVGDSGNLDHN